MLLEKDYIRLGDVPEKLITDVRNLALTIDWTKEVFNRNNDVLISKVVRTPFNNSARAEIPQEQTDEVKTMIEVIKPVSDWMLGQFKNHIIVKCEATVLLPKTQLSYHVDPCWFHQHSHRVHIPIITNPDALWCIEDRYHHFDLGGYYEVNNRIYHSFCNNGSQHRLHLLFDLMDNDVYSKSIEDNIDLDKQTFDSEFLSKEDFLAKLPELKTLTYY